MSSAGKPGIKLQRQFPGQNHSSNRQSENFSQTKSCNLPCNFLPNIWDAPFLILVYVPHIPVNIDPGMNSLVRYNDERMRLTSFLSAAALVQNILILAYEKGLGTCWTADPKRAEDEINDILESKIKSLWRAFRSVTRTRPRPYRRGRAIKFTG
ncbi:nitroreductase family protein [Desulfofundulus thermobenzoicus]|uniref:nitroreductase family protein n=1 Tax=Desulfofundulus thermobenzoicus TaxID=29376 RepID=UPI003C12C0A9